jgi:hypothetical protein
MRVTTKAVFDIASGELLEWEGFEYSGPVEQAGSGPSAAQNAAAASQARLTDQTAAAANRAQDFVEAQQAKVSPFYTSRMNFGDPNTPTLTDYASGTNAQAYAPARANIIRSLGSSSLPSGSRQGILANFEDARARGFDSNLSSILGANERAKEAGASGLLGQAQIANPGQYYGLAMGGNSSIMNANLRKPGMAGTIGSLIGAGAQLGSAALT